MIVLNISLAKIEGMQLNKHGGIEIYIAAEKPDGYLKTTGYL
jgi:hypothetical protein